MTVPLEIGFKSVTSNLRRQTQAATGPLEDEGCCCTSRAIETYFLEWPKKTLGVTWLEQLIGASTRTTN